jgi:hypothetical protein
MSDLARLVDAPYLQGNPAFALTPERKRAGMFGASAGIGRGGLSGRPSIAGVAPGSGMAANAISGRVKSTTAPAVQQGGRQAGPNAQIADRGLEPWRLRKALQGNPYLQMGGQ